MKQKRKVKSLISSNGENKNLLTALLFLVGGVLFCGALALFASIGGVASAENSDVIEYPGIDDKKEVLLRFGLIDEGGTTAVNEMFLTGKAFYVNGNAGLSVDGASDMSLGAGKYINFLGGKTDGSNIDSNNVTIIGGNQVKILENNDNTSFLGGSSNTVNPGNNSVSPVMLGGQNNVIGSNQEGSAIIGGRNNEIGGSTSYDFVIGGENNNIGSNSKNAIVGGARVTVNGGNSNLFAFSAGSEFNPKGGNAFYLNVQHGLGLNKAASDLSENNLGVDSNGAVSFGPIDITSSARKCTSDDYGVQGSFEGCLVGCTKLGADNGGKREMVDHGDKCKRLCEDVYSAYCIMSPIEPAKPDPYTSYCTTNGVDTGHAHHCGGEALVLPNYQNVLFETKLIDSDDSCPKPGTANWTENRCVFKCDGEYHLTGDQTGMGGRTKCYKDCKLPWDGTKIKHNETRIAYNTDETYCAFPSGSPASPHTCANHKETIMCQNGTLYLQKIDPDDPRHARKIADTSRPAITNGYVYSGCMLNQYRCNTDVYNYSASDITSSSKFNDTVTTWNLTDRGTTNGTRGVYRLCIDYNTNPNTVQQLNGEKCDALNLNSSVSPKRYTTHYQWVGCRPNYHTGAGYETVCMKDCTLKKTNNQVQYYRHNTTVVGYKTKQETCTSKCESATLVCNDGKWRLGSLNGTQTSAYVYNDCTLKDYTCASRYNVTETEKQAHESTSIYGNSCVPYKANNTDKETCTAQSTKYELTDCKSGYHTVNGKRCVSNYKEVNCNTSSVWKPDNSHFNVVSVGVYWKSSCGRKGSDETCWESPIDCDWDCDTNYHQEGSNLCCHDGEHSEDGSCTSNTSTAPCTQAGKPDYSDYIVENVSITYNESNGTWSIPANCRWTCWEGYSPNGNKCDKDPDPVNGNCGTVKYTCDAGTPKDETTTSTEYQWICGGVNGGVDSELCRAPRAQMGWCKGEHYECYQGNSENHNETDDEYTWTCKGINGGDDEDCSEAKDNTVKVKFKIVNNLNNLIYAHEVETGDPLDSCGLSAGGETDFIVEKGKSVTSDYSTYTFIAGQTYNLELVYGDGGDCEGNNALCTRAYATFTAVVGENIVTFNVYSETYGPTPGECGDSNNGMFDSKPTSNLCDAGLESSVTTTSTGWVWTCGQGTNAAYCKAWAKPGCGPINNGRTCSVPTSYLCTVGTPTPVSPTSPYTWYCQNGGATSDKCSATYAGGGSCGSAHGGAYTSAPTSNLCNNGTAGEVTEMSDGSSYVWQCTSCDVSVTCTAVKSNNSPSCGSANGGTYSSTPTSNLCSKGTASSVSTFVSDGVNTRSCGNGYTTYEWSCTLGGNYVNCAACGGYVGEKVNGECGSSLNNCTKGTYKDVTDTTTQYKWSCEGINGGTTANCSKDKDPVCGNVHYNCTVGSSTNNHNTDSQYLWTCGNGGKTVDCSEAKSSMAVCESTHYGCEVGTVDPNSKNEGNTEWTWTCKGVNGGDDASCSESCPEGQIIVNGECKSSPSPITINICPYVTYDQPQQYGSCYLGNALHNVYYLADRAVPKSISIEATFTYRMLSSNNPSSCSYDSNQKSATYTIEAGNIQSSELLGSRDILHRYATTYSATYGFENYFDPSFISMSAEVSDTFTYNGQEYIINVKNDACGEIVNTRVDGKCGTNNTPATRCSAGTVSDYDSSTKSRKCVGENGGDTVSCKYSCTTVGGTCECPDGYEMNSSNNCVFVGYKFCAHQLCKCDNFQIGNNNTPCACIDGTYEGKGSNTCFGDSSQRAKGTIGAWVARIEPYTNSRISADGFDGSNADDEFHLVGFKDESSKCADPYANNLDYLVNNCSSLVRGTNSQLDNGFILKNCSGVPSTAEACCSGGTESCKVMTVGGGSGFEPELLPRD